MTILRFLMLLSLGVWLGALIFFPFVAQTAFTSLPSHSAGVVVRGSLLKLHWAAFTCGLVFLSTSLTYDRATIGEARILRSRYLLIVIMLALTSISQFHIIPRMDALRLSAREISALPASDPVRAQFDSLHAWSTRLEGVVLVLGLIVLYLISHPLSEHA